ncbi:MAG: PA14 domain-containing protein [candidate division KSB1 bacterium]|nr:PA14 domain-containing protein [candidate division KSB1 bacterium]MDZ7346056.1 PA14 domain-containing protein [candidate division KSB1 bacterium]
MRTSKLLFLALLASLLVFCGKKEKTAIGPTPIDGDGDGGQATAFILKKHAIIEQLPDFVVTLFTVTDMDRKGVTFLTVDRFQVIEQNQPIDLLKANAFLLKRADLNYTLKTRIIIDNNQGSNLELLKKGAVEFIKKMDYQQQIAVYTLSDKLNKIIDFTNNQANLIAAVEGITEGNAAFDLYGAVLEAYREDKEEYTADNIIQNSVVLFIDSNDTVGSYPIDVIKYATIDRQIYTVGYGSNLNSSDLSQVGVKSFYQATTEAAFLQNAVKAQSMLVRYADSFYWLSYRSAKRNAKGHTLKITVAGNLNTGEGSEIIGTFDSESFVDVANGLYVNWSYSNPQGINLLLVQVNNKRTIQVLSMGGGKVPSFSYSLSDPNVVTLVPGGGGRLTVIAKGAAGDSCKLTIRDTANNLSKEITIRLVAFQMGYVLLEWWDNIQGTAVADLTKNPRFPKSPSGSKEINIWEIEKDKKDNYGTRIRGYIHPPVTGKYIFWISSDDASELWLSKDSDPANKVKICYVASWTASREWTKETNQKSAPISLEAGKHYYMESLHKEGGGGDNLAVAWQAEGGKLEVIGGDYLSLYIGD